jgi:predicted metalloprotease with PDZ domain
MNDLQPYDWRTFFTQRLQSHGPGAPLGGLENSGWKLVFNETINDHERAGEVVAQVLDAEFSLGFSVHAPNGEESDRIEDVIPGSPAERAGLAPGMHLMAVNGRKWTPELLREAIRQSKTSKQPLELLAENGDYFQTYHVDYHGGERYPHLEAIGGKSDVLSEIAKMRAAPVALPTNY